MTKLVTVTQRVDTIVKALRRKPLQRFSTAELSDITGIDRTVLTSNMKHWMTKNLGDMAHVHIEAAKGHAHYYYDPDNVRTEPPGNVRNNYRKVANTNGNGHVEVEHVPVKRSRKNALYLKFAAEEQDGQFVLAYTEDGRVLQGRWLT